MNPNPEAYGRSCEQLRECGSVIIVKDDLAAVIPAGGEVVEATGLEAT
jgi:hypothetical protein